MNKMLAVYVVPFTYFLALVYAGISALVDRDAAKLTVPFARLAVHARLLPAAAAIYISLYLGDAWAAVVCLAANLYLFTLFNRQAAPAIAKIAVGCFVAGKIFLAVFDY
jgi:hypothetical protein